MSRKCVALPPCRNNRAGSSGNRVVSWSLPCIALRREGRQKMLWMMLWHAGARRIFYRDFVFSGAGICWRRMSLVLHASSSPFSRTFWVLVNKTHCWFSVSMWCGIRFIVTWMEAFLYVIGDLMWQYIITLWMQVENVMVLRIRKSVERPATYCRTGSIQDFI